MKKRVVLAVISGLLTAAAHPPVGAGFLAWAGLVPLLFAVEGARKRDGFILGFVSGFAFFVTDVYWVVHSMYFYGGVPAWISVPVMCALAGVLAIYIALFALFVVAAADAPPMILLLVVPSVWTSLEFLRGYLFSGFPWSLLGYTQTGYLAVIQIADITGVYGLSFVIVLVNTAAFLFIRSVARKEAGRPVVEALIACVLFVSIILYGTLRIKQVDADVVGWQRLRVAATQGSIDQSEKWNAAFRSKTVDIYRELTRSAVADGAQLVVWPETAVPFFIGEDEAETARVTGAAAENRTYILTGSPAYTYNPDTRQVSFYNSAYLLTPSGEIAGRYDKVHLVPFGEYVPLKRFLPFVKKMTAGVGDFMSGNASEPLRFEAGGIGVLICYEAIFPELAAAETRNGADMLVNITNDAWFGRTSAPYQHFGMSIMRAVENKTFLVRSANTGISAFVDPVGRVIKKTGLFEKTVITGDAAMRRGPLTFYTSHGDVFAYGCMVISAAFIFTGLRRKRGQECTRN